MILNLSCTVQPNRAALGVRWLVLMVILFGTVFSSIGGTNSHGIAVIAASLHATPASVDAQNEQAHGHAHGEEEGEGEWMAVGHGTAPDHPHHGADHSHDKAHALPTAWLSFAPQLPDWTGRVRPWIEMVQASRLERPPMG
ncbi:MAG: hypothetical protein Q7J58_10400 [Hydrogenophaga sp.]|jgi:hypothetical protein|uniref:hypothetical protein n=1 Tax=Hydrogenophaga sp. TaxID=1904254 RepID=UPI002725A96F|nr:hypothetical protein [Hydrogenophaga sp.]MDO9569775.1 hypothetical protein [Hydrogenophaga sp.]MDP3376202.1 hypothetical protein [Hydrogenophaga sp.]